MAISPGGIIDSVRVLGAMARVTAPTLVDIVRGDLERERRSTNAHGGSGAASSSSSDVELTATGSGSRAAGSRVRLHVEPPEPPRHPDAVRDAPVADDPDARQEGAVPDPAVGARACARPSSSRSIARTTSAAMQVDRVRGAAGPRRRVSIYLAPEGTRSRDGRIGKLKKGGFHLALGTGAPIVPVAIRGTIDILPRGGKVDADRACPSGSRSARRSRSRAATSKD